MAAGASITSQQLAVHTGRSIGNPAETANPGALAVGAANWATPNAIESYSNTGPSPDGRIKPDLVGVDRADTFSMGPGGFPGTSQASPHVAGLAALVAAAHPSYTPAEIADYLKYFAEPRGGINNTWGYGLARVPDLCSFTATPTNVNAPAAGGPIQVNVTTQPGCAWSTGSQAGWLTIQGGSGTGSGASTIQVAANGGAARTGTVTRCWRHCDSHTGGSSANFVAGAPELRRQRRRNSRHLYVASRPWCDRLHLGGGYRARPFRPGGCGSAPCEHFSKLLLRTARTTSECGRRAAWALGTLERGRAQGWWHCSRARRFAVGPIEWRDVRFSWTPPATGGAPTHYLLEAGSAPGLTNIAVVPVSSPGFFVPGVPPGTYYVRVRAANGAGVGPASNEVELVVAGMSAPGTPGPVQVTVVGSTVTLGWSPNPVGAPQAATSSTQG